MCRKTRNNKAQKTHNAKCGKGGFTLVELCVVLALFAILVTMIVSFSVLMNGFASNNKADYEFLKDHARLKEKIGIWAAENDVSGCVFLVGADGTLTVTADGNEKSVSLSNGELSLGGEQISGFNTIDGITFTANDKLIKCVTYRIDKDGNRIESSFVFSLRSGTVDVEEVAGNE